MSRIEEMLVELRDCSDTRPYWAELDGWSVADLENLAHAITALPDDRHWAYGSVLDHVIGLLVKKPDPSAVVRVALGGLPVTRMPKIARMLADPQSEQTLVSLLANLPDGDHATELGACLLHEMILRRKSVTPVAGAWTRRLDGHPLAGLPLHPLPGETWLARGLWPDKQDPLTLAGTIPSAEREPAPPDMTTIVANWLTQSNGRVEAAVFRLASPLAPDEVGVRTLESLGLDCLAGNGLTLRRAGLEHVAKTLFHAAMFGGAYSSGLGGAYGRAAMWRSLNALAGGSHVGATWWIFDAANDWFHRVAWDLGVVCLRPGGHVMAVVAATDTD
jgi:Family of unknown function (DUF6183)